MKIIACDIGGTEIKGKLFDSVSLKEVKLSTNQTFGRESIMDTLKEVISQLWDDEVAAIGIVTAGAVNPDNGMIVSNTGTLDGWLDFSIKDAIFDEFHIPVFVENDANGAMIAEMEMYLKKGIKNACMITLGTGVGTALYIDSKLYNGSTFKVEFGHMVLYPNGVECTCGQKGCSESYLSGTALTRRGKTCVDESIVHGKEVFELYKRGNKDAVKVINDYVDDLVLFLNNIDKVVDPQLYIIGGGVIHSKDVLLKVLEDKLKDFKPVVPAVLGNDAGIKGAYLLAIEGMKNEEN